MENNIIKEVVIVFILAFAILGFICLVSASESCYVRLSINETKINNQIQFYLLSQENLWGNYANAIPSYGSTSDYFLNVYNPSGLNKYSLYSSRFIFYDNFNDSENPGGMIEEDNGIIDVIVPYSNISRVTVINNGSETDLDVDSSAIQCIKTCKDENETGIYETDSCCEGLTEAEKDTDNFVCIKCGDGICSDFESLSSCYSDCSGTCGDKKKDGNELAVDCGPNCNVGCAKICNNKRFDSSVEEAKDCGGYCDNYCNADISESLNSIETPINQSSQQSTSIPKTSSELYIWFIISVLIIIVAVILIILIIKRSKRENI